MCFVFMMFLFFFATTSVLGESMVILLLLCVSFLLLFSCLLLFLNASVVARRRVLWRSYFQLIRAHFIVFCGSFCYGFHVLDFMFFASEAGEGRG